MESFPVTLDGRTLPVTVRRSVRARRITLTLTPGKDGVRLTLPKRASLETALKFLHSKASWVREHTEMETATPLCDGAVLPIFGQCCRVRREEGRGVTHLHPAGDETFLLVYGASAFTARRLRDYCVRRMHEECGFRARLLAERLGKSVHDIKIRDLATRWGSCSASGTLTFNWRLIFAPLEILDYLIAHEVAHLAEMNHSSRFWAQVAQLCPEFKRHRAWLRAHGHVLHRFRSNP